MFRAITKYKEGSGGSSTYLVIDGRMRYVRGLESIPEFIDAQKKPMQ